MIGIYKIQNKVNNKIYIGQSNNIKRRFKEHRSKGEKSRIPVDIVIKKEGKDNFTYEIIEECSVKELNEREKYWINYYNSTKNGYNCSVGGDQQSIGENNGRAILTEKEVMLIRKAYNNHERRKDVYKNFNDKISFHTFSRIWDGTQWSHIMPEVFTEENKLYYSRKATNGGLSVSACFTNKEVIQMRRRYVNETAREIYKDYNERCNYQTLQQILWGRVYTDLPIYKKKEKRWINTEACNDYSGLDWK